MLVTFERHGRARIKSARSRSFRSCRGIIALRTTTSWMHCSVMQVLLREPRSLLSNGNTNNKNKVSKDRLSDSDSCTGRPIPNARRNS